MTKVKRDNVGLLRVNRDKLFLADQVVSDCRAAIQVPDWGANHEATLSVAARASGNSRMRRARRVVMVISP